MIIKFKYYNKEMTASSILISKKGNVYIENSHEVGYCMDSDHVSDIRIILNSREKSMASKGGEDE